MSKAPKRPEWRTYGPGGSNIILDCLKTNNFAITSSTPEESGYPWVVCEVKLDRTIFGHAETLEGAKSIARRALNAYLKLRG